MPNTPKDPETKIDKRIGNQFWKFRTKHGRDKTFKTPEMLWEAACEYFEWVEDNPLQKAIIYQGEVSKESEDLMRPMTIGGLCISLGVHAEYLAGFESDLDLETSEGKEYSQIVKAIRQIIYEQKFAGATAGLMNPNIIARDLGLADKKEVKSNVSVTALLSEIKQSTDLPDDDIDD